MDTIVNALQTIINSTKYNFVFSFTLVAILWAIQILNALSGYNLNMLGIWPRKPYGLVGIFFSPFLHGDFNHLFFNSIPLFVLANLVLLNGQLTFYYISFTIMILGGLGIWLFGKRGIHIGASTIIMGYFGYLLSQAYFQLTPITIIVAILCLYYFGGLVFSLFPGKKGISWEGHVFGFLAGIASAYLLPFYRFIL